VVWVFDFAEVALCDCPGVPFGCDECNVHAIGEMGEPFAGYRAEVTADPSSVSGEIPCVDTHVQHGERVSARMSGCLGCRTAAAMHIAVDAHNLLIDRRGIGVYLRAVLSRMLRGDDAVTLLVNDFWPGRLRREFVRELGSDRFAIARRVPGDADVVWHPWNGAFFDGRGVPEVATIHDVVPFAFPAEDTKLRESQQRPFLVSAARASHIVTDSEFSRTEILRYLGIEAERIRVVALAASETLHSPWEGAPRGTSMYRSCSAVFSQLQKENALRAFAKKSEASQGECSVSEATLDRAPYILAVGANDFRKNLETLAHAHRVAFPNGEVVLVCVGKNAPDGAIELTDVSLDDLKVLYEGALAFAMPSIYEGFGIPPLEAMMCGTPVVVSRAASLPEVCGDAALYVNDPMDVNEWSTALRRIANDADLRQRLHVAGLEQAKKFNWDKTTAQTFVILRSASGTRVSKDRQ